MKQHKSSGQVKKTNRIIIFLITLFIIGIICGSLFLVLLNNGDKEVVNKSIESFINTINSNELNYFSTFINTFIANLTYVLIIWLLGISVIGLPIIIIMYFSKSFILGFSIASIFYKLKASGLLFSLFYLFPAHLINVLVYTLLLTHSTRFSLKIGKAIMKKGTIDFKVAMRKYIKVLIISILGIFLASLLEVFLTPLLLKLVS